MKSKYIFCFLVFFMVGQAISCSQKEEILSRQLTLSDGWKVQQSSKIHQDGKAISSVAFETHDWYTVTIPSTVMGALTKAGLYPDIMVGKNMKSVNKTPFDSSWWFRKEFQLPKITKDEHVHLDFNGISYYANIWLNGELVASRDQVYGPFRQFSFDITPLAKENNVLAVEVFRAQSGDPNIGFVDWNPRPADENMGIFREVHVSVTGSVEMKNACVKSRVNTETLKEAWLTVEAELTNHSDTPVSGVFSGQVENINFTMTVDLKPNEKKTIITPELYVKNPRIWWCNNLGTPEMYGIILKFKTKNQITDQKTISFGIREIKDYFTEEGYRGFMLNGKKILVKSAGWTDDIFLRDTPETNEIQVKYVKDMNLNSIRFENIWGNSQNIYNLCDKYGLLVLVGWSCHWEWSNYLGAPCDKFGGIKTEDQMNLIAESFEDQILWLRNHPSIIAWFAGSDMIPRPELEKKYMEILNRIDNRPYIAAAGRAKSEISGNTGMKMNGPYEYVGSNYWYEDTRYGGAYGFNTETGIGAQLPVYESILKFIPEDKLWPINDNWNYHCTKSSPPMNSLFVLTETMNQKLGVAKGLQDYLMKADVLNYEGTRAMFEAFRVNSSKTTGIVQWMLNSAWPSLYWQLYDYYLIPTSAYYSVRKANYPQQLIYNYKENAVYAVNESIGQHLDAKAVIMIYSLNSRLIEKKELNISVEPASSKQIVNLDPVRENIFLSLQILDDGDDVVLDNFYWLSPMQDKHDWMKSEWYYTPIKKYADQKVLSRLPESKLEATAVINTENEQAEISVNLNNSPELITFFVKASLKKQNGDIIFPVFWSDNYISLLPGEQRILKCTLNKTLIEGNNFKLVVRGWNLPEQEVVF